MSEDSVNNIKKEIQSLENKLEVCHLVGRLFKAVERQVLLDLKLEDIGIIFKYGDRGEISGTLPKSKNPKTPEQIEKEGKCLQKSLTGLNTYKEYFKSIVLFKNKLLSEGKSLYREQFEDLIGEIEVDLEVPDSAGITIEELIDSDEESVGQRQKILKQRSKFTKYCLSEEFVNKGLPGFQYTEVLLKKEAGKED